MAPNKKRSAKNFGDADDVSPPRKTRRNGPARPSIIDIEPVDINVNAIVNNRVHSSSSNQSNGSWNDVQSHETRIQSSPTCNIPLFSNNIVGPEKNSRIVRDIIPEFTGKNMSVNSFLKHCKVVIAMVDLRDMPYLTMLILTKITGEARNHIQDKSDLELVDILKTLERIYSCKEDVSQLLQTLANTRQNPEESVQEYGGRVNQILNKLTTQVLINTPGEKGLGRCEAYKETVVGNFLRGLDFNLYMAIQDKDIKSLDDAIALAAKADQKLKSWDRVHGSVSCTIPSTSLECDTNFKSKQNDVFKRVAHVRTDEIKSKRDINSIQCFKCKQYGHYKRDCTNFEKINVRDKESSGCGYCYRNNHSESECRLKSKHEKERSRFSQKSKQNFLNSKRVHLTRGLMTQNGKLSQVNVSSSHSGN